MFNKLFWLFLLHSCTLNASFLSKTKNAVEWLKTCMDNRVLKYQTVVNYQTSTTVYAMWETRKSTKNYAAVYKVAVTQCLKTGYTTIDFTTSSLRPGVKVPPISDIERQAVMKWIATNLR